jgi:hypothetical protein
MARGLRQHKDAFAIITITGLAVAMEWDRLTGPTWIGMDTATAFFPWYSFLGAQLRAGHLPNWNPHTFAGTPFAADPESGWMYLPAMLAFTFLPLDGAVRVDLFFHVLLAALTTYALARVLGFNVFGALLASTIYAHSGFFEGHNICCYAYADVAAWLPLALLGVELSISATSWRPRVLAWGVAGLAGSQILAAWIGQGAYYAGLVIAVYLACRSLIASGESIGGRLKLLAINGGGITLITAGLAAAGVLPRLEYNLVSNLPGGYADADSSLRATSWNAWGFVSGWDRLLLKPGFEYVGWLVLFLACAAVVIWTARLIVARPSDSGSRAATPRMVPFFAVLGLAVLIVSRAEPTPLHALLSVLPGFERVHARSPERALIVLYLAPALLAGATLTWFTRTARASSAMVGVAVIAVVSANLHMGWTDLAAESLAGGGDYQFARVDLDDYVAPTAAAQFLIDQASTDAPFRYFGYAGHVFGGPMPYTLRWADSRISALQVNNRALLTGLEDIDGYNPIHIARYGELVDALNGRTQNYHQADVYPSGLDSPLVDLLNVRYIIMPAALAEDEVAPTFSRPLTRVYADAAVQIFENPTAFPRAWIVHAAQEVAPGAAITALVNDPPPDLRSVAILETSLPSLEPTDSAGEAVSVTRAAADKLRVDVNARASGLLVLSEIAFPAWHATLDGQTAPILTADGALRAISVPAGQHVIEMTYQSTALEAGLALTAMTAAALTTLAILHFSSRVRRLPPDSHTRRCPVERATLHRPGAQPARRGE